MPPNDGDRWRINFSRVEWDVEVAEGKYRKVKGRPEHNWVWSPQGVIDMHPPERWGYLQFSSAEPGTATFKLDPDWEVRDTLHRAYYAQRAYFATHGKFTASATDLGLKLPAERLRVEATRSNFEVAWTDEKTGKPKYAITHDGRLSKS